MQRADRSLLDRCIRGDSAAQFELFDRLFDRLMSVARRYECDPQHRNAIVNTAFMRILQHLPNWQPTGTFEGWCHRIAVTSALSDLRDRKYQRVHEADPLDDHSDAAYTDVNEAVDALAQEDVQRLVDRLPPVTKQVFNLYAIDGWKHKEIAEQLGMAEGTSKWHLNHARKQLQRMLGIRAGLAALVLTS